RHWMGRPANLSILPAPAAVGGYLHFANGAPPGPRQARDFVEPTTEQLLSPGRKRYDRFRSNLDGQRGFFRVLTDMPVIVVGHVVPVHHLDSSQVLDLIDPFKAGNHQPQRKALLRT